VPTTYMCYQVVKQDLWIAALGCIADYYMPDFIDEFKEKYPELMNEEGKTTVGSLYFDSKLGTLIKIFSFCLKGKTTDVTASMKVLTRINSPWEILNQETPQGKFIFRRYERINKLYDETLNNAMAGEKKDKLLVFIYTDDKMSFTGDLANELLHRFPGKTIIVGRKKDDEVRMSIRSSKIQIPPILEKCLEGLEGYGGGHEYACGANVKQKDFDEFVKRIRKSVD
ncbi:MAG: DHH family phosphoesterase, partial [Nanoarchaeota archaeon]